MTGLRWTALGLAALLCARLAGDEPEPPRATPGPLPRYYRKLGLDKEQVEKVRTTRAEYQTRIDKLKRQLQALEKEQSVELEKHLTAAQKARLKELQAQGPGEFKISAPRMPLRVQAGKAREFGVQLIPDMGFEGDVRLTYPDLPKGVKITPAPFIFKEGGDPIATLTVRTDKDLSSSEHRFTILATPDYGEPVEATVRLLVTP